jgi:thiol-disulfide isomerase/thioredoxin
MNTEITSGRSVKQHTALALRVVLALLFLVSAAAKVYPSPYFAMTTFEVRQLLPMGFSETGAAYFSRILIGCELALGFLLLQKHFFRQLVLPVSFLLLLIFSIHLTAEIITTGNSGNCGCFGSLLPMPPLQAVIKNVIAMGLLVWLFKITDKASDKKNFPVVLSITLASVLFIFLIGPMRYIPGKTTTVAVEVEEDEEPAQTDTSAVETAATAPVVIDNKAVAKDSVIKKVDEPAKKRSGFKKLFADIDKGKKVLCFFAPGCDHCQETAKQLTELKKESTDFPDIRIVFMDEETELIPAFLEKAGAKYPHIILDVGQFWQTLGGNRDTPGVFYLWNGNILKTYDGINEKAFKKAEFKTLAAKPWGK